MKFNIFISIFIASGLVKVSYGLPTKVEQKILNTLRIYYYHRSLRQEKNIDLMEASEINSNLPVKIAIHGFIADRNHFTIEPIKYSYSLKDNEVNLLVADWKQYAALDYEKARNGVQNVGFKFGQILEVYLNKSGISLDNVHVLGHSLGSHVAGGLGRYFKGKIGRITALDPAGPGFSKSQSITLSWRDAKFVDVIHTNGYALGFFNPLGHIDFYPNFGRVQPGCEVLDFIVSFSCSHARSALLFAESTQLPDNFMSVECSMAEISKHDRANLNCVLHTKNSTYSIFMGENVDQTARGVFYLDTNNVFPYGRGNIYSITNEIIK